MLLFLVLLLLMLGLIQYAPPGAAMLPSPLHLLRGTRSPHPPFFFASAATPHQNKEGKDSDDSDDSEISDDVFDGIGDKDDDDEVVSVTYSEEDSEDDGDGVLMEASGAKKATSAADEVVDTSNAEGAIELDARTFSKQVGDGNIWLLEFYAPWCSHCTSFTGTYDEVAKHLHATTPAAAKLKKADQEKRAALPHTRGVKVAKINGDKERALGSRFGVESYPTFYLVDGYDVYEFEKVRNKKNLIDFCYHYKTWGTYLPWLTSAMGPVGLMQGSFIQVGFRLTDLYMWIQTKFGLGPLMTGALMLGSAFIGCFITIVLLAVIITPTYKPKTD